MVYLAREGEAEYIYFLLVLRATEIHFLLALRATETHFLPKTFKDITKLLADSKKR